MKRSSFAIVVLLVGAMVLAGCATNPIDLGRDAALKGNYQEAINYWVPEARRGNSRALFNLALFARDGVGMPADRQQAIRLFTLAAQAGLPEARFELSQMGAPVPEVKPIDPNLVLMYLMLQNQQQSQPQQPIVPPLKTSPTYNTDCTRDRLGNVNCTTRQY